MLVAQILYFHIRVSVLEQSVRWFPLSLGLVVEDKPYNLSYALSIPVPTQITKAYVTSRLESVETVLRENLENPLDDKTMVSQQLDQLATIGRYVYIIWLHDMLCEIFIFGYLLFLLCTLSLSRSLPLPLSPSLSLSLPLFPPLSLPLSPSLSLLLVVSTRILAQCL